MKRSASSHPTPIPSILARFKRYVERRIPELVPRLVQGDVLPRQQYIRESPHPRSVKKSYAECYNNLLEGKTTIFQASRVDAFVKEETYVEYKPHRLILPRPDEIKVLIGPTISAIEKLMYRNPQFIKKVPVEDRPSFIMNELFFEGCEIYVCDYTGFESQFTPELMRSCELLLLEYCVRDLSEGPMIIRYFKDFIAGWNTIRFNGGEARVEGTRMSGEMTTSLFNGFSNLMFMEFVCIELCGATRFSGVVEGDDGLFTMQTKTVPQSSDFAKLGLTIKFNRVEQISEASFCGMVFHPVDRAALADPLKLLCNVGYTGNRYVGAKRTVLSMLLKAKLMSYYVQYRGCPIVEVLSATLLRYLTYVDVRPLLSGNHMTSWERETFRAVLGRFNFEGERPIGQHSRLLVERLFNVPVSNQIQIESQLRDTGLGPFFCPAFLELVPKDWVHFFDTFSTPYVVDELVVSPNLAFVEWLDVEIGKRNNPRIVAEVRKADHTRKQASFPFPEDPVDPSEFCD